MGRGWQLWILSAAISSFLATSSASCVVEFETLTYDNFRGVCSGHGECSNVTNLCTCEDGYTGRSDWLNTEGLDCQLNKTLVLVFWGINAVFGILYQFKTLPKMLERYREFREKQKAFAAQGKPIAIHQNRGLIAILFYEFWVLPGLIICAITKFSLPDERVGITPFFTFLFSFVKIGFYWGVAYMFQPSLIKTLLQSGSLKRNKKVQRLILVSDAFARINCTASVLLSLTPWITVANGGELNGTAEAAWVIYFAGSIISLMTYNVQSFYLKSKIKAVLSTIVSSNKSSGIAQTQAKLIKMQKTIIGQTLFQSCLYGMFLFWPYLWNKHDYFLPLSWLAFIVISKELAESHVSSGGTSSKAQVGAYTTTASNSKASIEDGSMNLLSNQTSMGGSMTAMRTPAPPSAPVIDPPDMEDAL
uniref:Epidermal growth factor-like domain-containing protein n=1 Tax=Aplanochytrium stocchinoi TaxID=215587 RepID=A0A6S8F1N7_9STRA|mmetsp:Transcript_12048/g.14981  ORF Transcript_12048/g.14981 Transcript_12048/m.14981 type:complete len:418 (+) Transcript_12048:241-1494(+)